jgi:hypothetical protein
MLRSTKRISPTLRRRIDAAASELADIANTLKPDFIDGNSVLGKNSPVRGQKVAQTDDPPRPSGPV